MAVQEPEASPVYLAHCASCPAASHDCLKQQGLEFSTTGLARQYGQLAHKAYNQAGSGSKETQDELGLKKHKMSWVWV